jgi:pilus assembly protein Flp/PilA
MTVAMHEPWPVKVSANASPPIDLRFMRERYLSAKPNGVTTTQRMFHVQKIKTFLRGESAATAIEYGLIAAGIPVAIIAGVNTLGSTLNAKFPSISTQLK